MGKAMAVLLMCSAPACLISRSRGRTEWPKIF